NPQLGLTEEDILGKTDYDFLPQEEAETIVEAKKKVMKSGKPMHFETSLISLSGEAEFFTGTFMPIFDAQNQTNGLIGYFRNITESKKAEEKIYLQASLIEQVDSAIITIDFDNKILSWNDHAETLYQWKKDEAIGKDIIELLGAEELKEETLKNFEDLNRDGHWEGEYSVKRKDGSRLPVHIVNTYLKDKNGEKIGFIGVSNDITERKQASEALAESEEKFSKIFERSPMAIFLLDPISRNFIDMNNAFKTLFGYAEEELIGQNIDEFNMIVDHEKDIELQKRLEEYGKVDSSIINYRKKDGTIGWAIGSGELLNISGQQLIMSILIDITDQKEAEDAIRFQANLLKAVEQSVIVTNPDGEIIYWNPFAEKTYGWASEEAVGQNIVDVTVPRLSKEQAADIMETLNAGNSWSGEFEVQHRDGTIFPSFVSDTPVCNDKREISAVISVSTDISERKQTETELENYRNDLEKKVEQRTKEVQTKMEERQKLFDLMVGREVRMAELKKVIKKLRTQIEDAGLTPMANDPLLSD
ncbi:MAG: PAS domain S-box protein, partial [Chloroflexi bacterium]